MKMRMKTRRAGSAQANIIQMGKGLTTPRGLMNQPLLSGLVTEKPLGTLSFYRAGGAERERVGRKDRGRGKRMD
jgi:hypothetical protein